MSALVMLCALNFQRIDHSPQGRRHVAVRIIEVQPVHAQAIALQHPDKRSALQIVSHQLHRDIGQPKPQPGGLGFHVAVRQRPLPLWPMGDFFPVLHQFPLIVTTVGKLVGNAGMSH